MSIQPGTGDGEDPATAAFLLDLSGRVFTTSVVASDG